MLVYYNEQKQINNMVKKIKGKNKKIIRKKKNKQIKLK